MNWRKRLSHLTFPTVREKEDCWLTQWGYHCTYTGNMVKNTSRDTINNHLGTFCGIWTFKHKPQWSLAFYSGARYFEKVNSFNSNIFIPLPLKTALYSAYVNPLTEVSSHKAPIKKIQERQVLIFMAPIQSLSELFSRQFLLLNSFHFSIQLYNDAKKRHMSNKNTYEFEAVVDFQPFWGQALSALWHVNWAEKRLLWLVSTVNMY